MITIEQAREYYQGADAVHDFDHVLRVLALAERLAQAEGADLEIVRAAVLLHDVARAQGDRMISDHALAGAEFVRRLLVDQPADKVEARLGRVACSDSFFTRRRLDIKG